MGADPFGDLWTCPRCGRRFANRNQTHACGRWTLARHLDGRPPPVVATVHAFIALAHRRPDPRFRRIETMSPRSHVHHFRLCGPDEVDDAVAGWLAEAYQVGLQRHLARRG
jgi:hypothetical protein